MQTRIAVDFCTLLHLPMVAGIVIFAFGVKTTLAHVNAHLNGVTAVALCCGIALYLLAVNTFKRGNIGSFSNPRVIAAFALVALSPATDSDTGSAHSHRSVSGLTRLVCLDEDAPGRSTPTR